MIVNEEECEKAGVDVRRVASIARRISRAALEAQTMGIQIFGGDCGELRFDEGNNKGALKLASLDGSFDGGDGAEDPHNTDGFMRGEYHRI